MIQTRTTRRHRQLNSERRRVRKAVAAFEDAFQRQSPAGAPPVSCHPDRSGGISSREARPWLAGSTLDGQTIGRSRPMTASCVRGFGSDGGRFLHCATLQSKRQNASLWAMAEINAIQYRPHPRRNEYASFVWIFRLCVSCRAERNGVDVSRVNALYFQLARIPRNT